MTDRQTECTCPNCEGTGKVLVARSWFPSDGYRRIKCGICAGSGRADKGYKAWPGHAEFQRRARANIAGELA